MWLLADTVRPEAKYAGKFGAQKSPEPFPRTHGSSQQQHSTGI